MPTYSMQTLSRLIKSPSKTNPALLNLSKALFSTKNESYKAADSNFIDTLNRGLYARNNLLYNFLRTNSKKIFNEEPAVATYFAYRTESAFKSFALGFFMAIDGSYLQPLAGCVLALTIFGKIYYKIQFCPLKHTPLYFKEKPTLIEANNKVHEIQIFLEELQEHIDNNDNSVKAALNEFRNPILYGSHLRIINLTWTAIGYSCGKYLIQKHS